MLLLPNKIVVVTGASRGIGRACALECAKHGATGFVLHYLGDEVTEKEVQSLKEQIEATYPNSKAIAVPGDIAQRETSLKVRSDALCTFQLLSDALPQVVEEGVKAFGRLGRVPQMWSGSPNLSVRRRRCACQQCRHLPVRGFPDYAT